jgi:hypothetical protein
LTQFNKFSWDKTAKETLAAYKYFEKQNWKKAMIIRAFGQDGSYL